PLASRGLFELALRRRICFVPGDVFSASQRYATCLRVSCGSSWNARIERGLETLGEIARDALVRARRDPMPARRRRGAIRSPRRGPVAASKR
ncbi:MAG: hypothetical protein DMD81_15690, partial [Candidatus Rokuibacteriota bacterium]